MVQGLAVHANKLKYLLNDHSTTILTGVGVVGTIGTSVLTARATFKAAKLITEQQDILDNALSEEERVSLPSLKPMELSKTEKSQLVWKLYLPPVATGVLTVTSIIVANKISSKKVAALVVATGVSERAFQEYKEKVVEKLGVKKDQEIRDEVAQDRVNNNPMPHSAEVLIAGSGDVLFYDVLTGRYFQSTVEDVKRAENKVNYELIHFMSCSLSHFYDEIGLPSTPYTDSVGWNLNNKMDVQFSTVLSSDNRPCISIDFSRNPIPNYEKHWE